jgi:hypothetical protein
MTKAQREQATHDMTAVRYAGFLGHEFVLVETYKGQPNVHAEINTQEQASKWKKPGDRLYRRIGRKWMPVFIF